MHSAAHAPGHGPALRRHATDAQGLPLPDVDGECAAAAVALFYSFNLQLQYEATQLLSALLTLEPLEEPVLKQLVALLQPPKHVRLLQHTATRCRRFVYPLVPLHVSFFLQRPAIAGRRAGAAARAGCCSALPRPFRLGPARRH